MSAERVSRADVERLRAERSARFFLTGGTGFLGSHIAAELLKRGDRVCLLARRAGWQSAEERVRALLDWLGLPPDGRGGLRVVEGDITMPGLGVEPAVLREVLHDTDEFIHCASNTAFSVRKKAEVEAVNLNGLSHVLDCAQASGAYFFHHVSTAFVAGKASGICLEALGTPREFCNVYEETKWHGERMAVAACEAAGLRLTIYRPSIVYGDSRTGRSLLFNAVYYPVRTALFIRDLYEADIRERGGKRAAEMGVRIEADGAIRLPLTIEVASSGGINLIPVDYFTNAFLALMEGTPEGGTFHIVNERTTRIEDIIDYSCRLFRMTGISACTSEVLRQVPKNALEVLYDRYVEAYAPYMRDTRVFDTARSRTLLERRGLACPAFDYEVFARCMTFAIEVGWGERLFTTDSVACSHRPSPAATAASTTRRA